MVFFRLTATALPLLKRPRDPGFILERAYCPNWGNFSKAGHKKRDIATDVLRPSRLDLGLPLALPEQFQRSEAHFVRHLAALRYPITKIQPWRAEAAALRDLPEDGECAEAAAALIGIVIGVYRRPALLQPVDDRDGYQSVGRAVFDTLGNAPRAEQERLILIRVCHVHAATGMARRHIAPIERKMAFAIACAGNAYY